MTPRIPVLFAAIAVLAIGMLPAAAQQTQMKFDRNGNDPKLVAFRKQYPQAYLKHVQGNPNEERRQGGGQRFLQRFWICYPCPSYLATATLAFDFDESGGFLGVTLVSIAPTKPGQ